jgi:hypothetical protein
MEHIQWLPAIVAGVVGFGLGGIWYSPVLFAKPWMRETGVNPKGPFRYPTVLPMAVAVGQAVVGAFVLSWLLGPAAGATQGLILGGVLGFLVVAPAIKMNDLFGQLSPTLVAIHTLFPALQYTLMGLILGLWPA